VDNGGGLRFSAQGRQDPRGAAFGEDSWWGPSTVKNNRDITNRISQDDINSQIASILERDNILGLIQDADLKTRWNLDCKVREGI
jgi:hypothetical protein